MYVTLPFNQLKVPFNIIYATPSRYCLLNNSVGINDVHINKFQYHNWFTVGLQKINDSLAPSLRALRLKAIRI